MEHRETHTFDAPIEAVWAMFTDPASHVAKFTSMGHKGVEILETHGDDRSFDIKITREVTVDLPGFAKRVLKPTNTVITTDHWEANDDGTYGGGWVIETVGAPVDIAGTTKLTPAGGQTRYDLTIDLKVNVPLVGGKIANWAKGDLLKQTEQEFAAGDTWLAEHA